MGRFKSSLYLGSKLLMIFLLFPYFLFAQSGEDKGNHVDELGRKQGAWVKYFPDGTKRYEGNFADDKPIGKFRYYYESGNRYSILEFFDEGIKSRAMFFHENGKLKAKGLYVKEKREGLWMFYDEKEQLTSKDIYQNGRKHGKCYSYYPNGSVTEEKIWNNGAPDGPHKQFYESGQLMFTSYYEKGKLQDSLVHYYPDGRMKMCGRYEDNVKTGQWVYYNEDGSIYYKQLLKKGKLVKVQKMNGVFREVYPGDIPKEEVNYKNGKKNGKFVEYYNQGEWVKEDRKGQEAGMPDETVRYLKDTQVKMKGNYKDDLLHGEVMYYQPDGTLEKKEVYKMGELVTR